MSVIRLIIPFCSYAKTINTVAPELDTYLVVFCNKSINLIQNLFLQVSLFTNTRNINNYQQN